MSKKDILIVVLFNLVLFTAEYWYFKTEEVDNQEGVSSEIVQTSEGPVVEVRATRLK